MSGDALDVLRQQIVWREVADIAQRKHPDHPLAFIDHRQSADFKRLHVPHRLGEIVILAAAMDAWRHHVSRGRGIEHVRFRHCDF